MAVLDAAKGTQFTFDADAAGMGQLNDLRRHFHVVLIAGDCLAVGHERAVHHDRCEAQVHGLHAGLGRVAVIKMQHDLHVGMADDGRLHQLLEVNHVAVLQGATAGLDDDRRVQLLGRAHDGLNLLHVVNIECADPVATFGSFFQRLLHRD